MTRNKRVRKGGRERHISVRGIRRETPDLRRLSRALISMALAQDEADAEAAATKREPKARP